MRKRKAKRIDTTKAPIATVASERDIRWQRTVAELRAKQEKNFQCAQIAYEKGFQAALWDTIVYCELGGIPKPKWASAALVQYAGKLMANMPYNTHISKGRQVRFVEKNEQIAADWRACDTVRRMIEGGASRKAAFIAAAEELTMTSSGVRKAVSRHIARAKAGNYYFSSLLPWFFHGELLAATFHSR